MDITEIHEELFSFLMNYRKKNPNFNFLPRKINRGKKLDKGYWFLGNDDYISISFFGGTDNKNKTATISFNVLPSSSKYLDNGLLNYNSYIQFTARDSIIKLNFIKKIVLKIQDAKQFKEGEFRKTYKSHDYVSNLKHFLDIDKPIIDNIIGDKDIDGLTLLNSEALKYIEAIETRRNLK
ncbi:MAG: hypothetical protein GY823_09230 [Flavobacteriaceae bacterium]|nr:hypothetical protein [Flavobacteriaceae bacterium]